MAHIRTQRFKLKLVLRCTCLPNFVRSLRNVFVPTSSPVNVARYAWGKVECSRLPGQWSEGSYKRSWKYKNVTVCVNVTESWCHIACREVRIRVGDATFSEERNVATPLYFFVIIIVLVTPFRRMICITKPEWIWQRSAWLEGWPRTVLESSAAASAWIQDEDFWNVHCELQRTLLVRSFACLRKNYCGNPRPSRCRFHPD